MVSVARLYARAFADLVFARGVDPQVALGELTTALELLQMSPELRRVLENPAIRADEKHKLLDALVARAGLSLWARNLIAVLVDHRRVPLLAQVVEQFKAELNRRRQVTAAEVTSARELDAGERSALEVQIAAALGRKIEARYRTEPGLLGGAVIRVGSTIYDGSVRGQLQRLQEQLSSS